MATGGATTQVIALSAVYDISGNISGTRNTLTSCQNDK